jgi:hypothetical protein
MLGHHFTSSKGTGVIAQVWFHSSQAFDKPLWSSDLLLGHTEGLGHEGVALHLGVVVHLDSFIKCLCFAF